MLKNYPTPEESAVRVTHSHSIPSYSSPILHTQVTRLKNVSFYSGTRSSSSNLTLPTSGDLKDWPEDSFCHEFLSNTFPLHSSLCGSGSDRVICSGTSYDGKTGSCTIKKVAIKVKEFYETMYNKRDSIETSNAIWLINDHTSATPICPNPDFKTVEKYMSGKDYVKRLAKASILNLPQDPQHCNQWVNGTTFMFISFDVHIYFKFLSWFSLYNGITNYQLESGRPPTLIIRLPQTKNTFLFPEFERELFSEASVVALQNLTPSFTGNLCFEQVIITPWAFATNAFRCKMADAIIRLRRKCYNCNSRDYPGSRLGSFRRKVLSACHLEDSPPYKDKIIRSIVIQLRKPYMRFIGDKPSKISRVMENSEGFINDIKNAFPTANVSVMIAESMDLCDQIAMVHQADVFIGVHGAGLVHLWWLQDHALMFELVPRSQVSNPTFKMLSTLTGRRYYGYSRIKGGEKKVQVDSSDIIKLIQKEF